MDTGNWLDVKPTKVLAHKKKRAQRPKELVQSLRKLTIPQRFYLYLLTQCDTYAEADKAMARAGYPYNRATYYRWRCDPRFAKAVELQQKQEIEGMGLNKAKVMLDAERAKQIALRPQPVLYKGKPTGVNEVNVGAYIRALELQGKGVGITDGDKNAVQVNVDIDFSGRSEQPGITIEQD